MTSINNFFRKPSHQMEETKELKLICGIKTTKEVVLFS